MARERPELMRLTKVQPAGAKGKGLFARVQIPKGTVVARMRKPARMKRSEVPEFQRRHPCLPDDFVIFAPRSSLVFFDSSWTCEGERIPTWYRLNHSSDPNTAPVVLDKSRAARDQEVAWITIKRARAGEELTFEYEDAPDGWE